VPADVADQVRDVFAGLEDALVAAVPDAVRQVDAAELDHARDMSGHWRSLWTHEEAIHTRTRELLDDARRRNALLAGAAGAAVALATCLAIALAYVLVTYGTP
jgi:hypothetical protein